MTFIINIFGTIGPIIILLLLGIFIRKKEILSSDNMEGIKKLIVTIALPCALFLAFLTMDLNLSLIILPVFVFFLCAITYVYGILRQKRNETFQSTFPYIMSSFEFGMLGLVLYAEAFGVENLGKLAIAALGQEFFVWFVMIPHVSGISGKSHSKRIILKSFITNPALIGIFAGLILNFAGYNQWKDDVVILQTLISVFKTLSSMVTPLILIFIGYGLVINRSYISETVKLILQRILIMIIPAAIFIYFVMNKALGLDKYYYLGIITLIILPAPFVIPLFLDDSRKHLIPRINSILVLYTVFSITAFCIVAGVSL